MAKLTTRETYLRSTSGGIMSPTRRFVTRHGMTTTAPAGKWRKLASEISVTRTGGSGDKAFEACVTVHGGLWRGWDAKKRASGYRTSCTFGRNPRAALSKALAAASRHMAKRSGAFARYR